MLSLFAILSDSFRLVGARLQNSDVSTFSPKTSFGSGESRRAIELAQKAKDGLCGAQEILGKRKRTQLWAG